NPEPVNPEPVNPEPVNLETARKVADTVLYEGYLLYPYRASAQKNRSRWQFGVVMPVEYAAADPSESPFTQAECVVEGDEKTTFTVAVRFLQVQRRTTFASSGTPPTTWDEAVEREIVFTASELPHEHVFRVDGGEE